MTNEDDFGFDWKETPLRDHPNKCNCPKHEHLKELTKTSMQSNNFPVRIKLCPEHYKVYLETLPEQYKEIGWWKTLIVKFARKIGMIKVVEIPYMQSDQCFYCRFGSGGLDKRNKIIPEI